MNDPNGILFFLPEFLYMKKFQFCFCCMHSVVVRKVRKVNCFFANIKIDSLKT